MTMKKLYLFVSMFLVVLLANGQKLPFQGKLIESGTPVNGTRIISVSIPDIGWSETHTVTVTDGLYFVVLGSTNPIPASIFSGVDERQMEISVNSNPLSAVTLYKPLSGDLSQLNVKGPGNGLIQGGFGTGSVVKENLPSLSMKGNLNESRLSLNVVGNSEGTSESAYINLNSTSGSLINLSPGWTTFTSTADGHSLYLANQGMYIHKEKTLGQIIAQNWGNKGFSGIINLSGPNSMNVQLGSRFWDNADLPWFDLRGTSSQGILQFFSTLDENESGIINILSKNGRSGWLTTTFLGLNSNGIRTASLETHEYGESKQKGVIILEDTDGNKSSFTPHHLTVNGPDWKEYVLIKGTNEGDNTHGGNIMLTGQDNTRTLVDQRGIFLITPQHEHSAELNGNGNAGHFYLNGPNSENFYLGNKAWENVNLPYFVMKGTTNNVVAEISASGDENENGYFNLSSKNGNNTSLSAGNVLLTGQNNKKAGISPEQITLWDANWERGVFLTSTTTNSPGVRGSLELFGADSPDAYKRTTILGADNFGNGDFGVLTLIGSHAQAGFFDKSNTERINLGVVGNDGETGRLVLRGTNPHIAFNDANDQNRVLIHSMEGPGGSSGHIDLRGPNTNNFYLGGATWENSDKPIMHMIGADGKHKMFLSTLTDDQGERGILTLSNNDGIETTYANNGTWGTIPFHMWSGAVVLGSLTVNGDINGSGTNNYNSDERLKKEIQPLGGSTLNKIETLGGYSYFWKKEEFPEKNFSTDQQIGLIAQELEAQFPALVKTGDDGFKSVNYNGFTAVLLQAVKELNQKVETLEKENRLLKDELVAATTSQKEMNELKSQIEALAKLVQIKIDSAGDTQSAENVSTNGLK